MNEFEIGDLVKVVNDQHIWLSDDSGEQFPNNTILTVIGERDGDYKPYVNLDDLTIELEALSNYPEDFEKVFTIMGGDELGVYRPKLEDRKVGKVRVELVDDGFPLALREIAKVMTWAQTAKGYKDHDWQNLPNPEQGLAGAASRHRTDHIIQRMVGKSAALECTDHESNLLHKAHEAFGVLAQLELILRGEIK